MGFPARIRDREAQQLLSGQHPSSQQHSPGLGQVAAFIGLARASLPTPPDPAAAAALVPQLAEAARAAGERGVDPHQPRAQAVAEGARPGRPRLRLAAKAAACAALVPAATVGLALAGVTLPEPAREAMESIGLELPNQPAVEQSGGSETPAPAARDARPGPRRPASGGRRGRDGKGGSGGAGKGRSGAKGGHGDGVPGLSKRQSAPASRGQGTPQLGAPAPILPPGQGGTPPGQGGPSPREANPKQPTPQGGGPPGDAPPGKAKQR